MSTGIDGPQRPGSVSSKISRPVNEPQNGEFVNKRVDVHTNLQTYLNGNTSGAQSGETSSSSLLVEDRDVVHLAKTDQIQPQAELWQGLISDIEDLELYLETADYMKTMSGFLEKADALITDLISISVVGERLSWQDLRNYVQLLNTVLSDLESKASTLTTYAPTSECEELKKLRDLRGKLHNKLSLVSSIQCTERTAKQLAAQTKDIESVLSSTKEHINRYEMVKPRSNKSKKSVSKIETVFENVLKELETIKKQITAMKSMEPSADLFWQASYYHHTMGKLKEIVSDGKWADSVSNAIDANQDALNELSKSDNYRKAEQEYNTRASTFARGETVECDGATSEGSLRSLSQNDISRLNSIKAEDFKSNTSSIPSIYQQPVSSEYHYISEVKQIGPFELEPFSEEATKTFFQEAPKLKGMPFYLLGQLRKLYKEKLQGSMEEKTLEGIFATGFDNALIEKVYDVDIAAAPMMPLKHSQVKLPRADGESVPLSASKIAYNDQAMGIAMNSLPEKDNELRIANTLEMICRENTPVMVDLVSDRDREKYSLKSPIFDWKVIPEEPGKQFGEYKISRTKKQVLELKVTVMKSGVQVPVKVTLREFDITQPDGTVKPIRQVAVHDWPDGGMPSPEMLDELHSLIDRQQKATGDEHAKLLVNCHAGVGRTGTLFATRYLREKAQTGKLDPQHLDQEAFDVIVQGKLSRNYDFVQYPVQIQGVRDAAERYATTYMKPSVKSPEPEPEPVQIGPYAVTAIPQR